MSSPDAAEMRHLRSRTRIVVVGLGALLGASAMLGVRVSAQPPARPPQSARPAASAGDGLLRSELSLMTRTVSIAVRPDLKTGSSEHRSLSEPTGAAADGRVRIGQLRTNGALQFGATGVGKLSAAGIVYDLSLLRKGDSWHLEATEVPAPDPAPPSPPGSSSPPASAPAGTSPPPPPAGPVTIALTRQPTSTPSSTLITALSPRTRDTAGLALTWGDLRLEADVQYLEPKLPRPNPNRQQEPINRKHDEPNAGARLLMLSQLNETALVWPGGARFSATFARTFPRGQRSISAAGTIGRPGPDVDGPDFARLMSTSDGAVVELTESPVPRLLVGAPLLFGKVVVRPGNQAPGYPGAYGLWLKRAGTTWRLVFNSESDVWGTQRDAKFDVGEVDLTYSHGGNATRAFGIALVPTAADRGRLVLTWGPHEWSAEFTASR